MEIAHVYRVLLFTR